MTSPLQKQVGLLELKDAQWGAWSLRSLAVLRAALAWCELLHRRWASGTEPAGPLAEVEAEVEHIIQWHADLPPQIPREEEARWATQSQDHQLSGALSAL